MRKRHIYLSNMDFEAATELFYHETAQFFNAHAVEVVKVADSLDRITGEPVYGRLSSPNHNAAAMDGIALLSEKTQGASEANPLVLTEGIDFVYVNTGNVITSAYDAVIMIEDIIDVAPGQIQIISAARPWQHVRPVGEDIVAGEMIVPQNHCLRPMDIGAIISSGIENIKVLKKPTVTIIPTGTEIIQVDQPMKAGEIFDSNGPMFGAMVQDYGGIAKVLTPKKDDYELLKNEIKGAAEKCDILIISAGSSAGSKDYTKEILEELGTVILHGVAIKPGKPVILGKIGKTPVVGIPGYPVSAYFVFEAFVKPLIKTFLGQQDDQLQEVQAVLSKRIVSSLKHLEFVRMKLGYVGDQLIATPLERGAGVSMSLVKADGILWIPKTLEGYDTGAIVTIKLLKPLDQIKHTLVSIGSHDLIVDLINQLMQLDGENKGSVSSAHVGSMGGIMALKRGETHLAPIHLLDEKTGRYNIGVMKQFFPKEEMALIKGVGRVQGLIVEKGNPGEIKDLEDVINKKLTYVNRQKGSGTRVLLDYLLNKKGINPEEITGYEREMTTHTGVGACVKSGSAHCGLGVFSAAKNLGLDFIPLANEDYDFAVRAKDLENPMIQGFVQVLKSQTFKNEVEELGGYDTQHSGEIVLIKEAQ